jgi:hypothetical protein
VAGNSRDWRYAPITIFGSLLINQPTIPYGKENLMIRAKHGGIPIFQKCINFGQGCKFGRFFDAHYSKEGLCEECEYAQFPSRVQGCLFCRLEVRYDTACAGCSYYFGEWAREWLGKRTSSFREVAAIDQGIREAMEEALTIHHPTLHKELAEEKKKQIKASPIDTLNEWPGFYRGNGVWIKPDTRSIAADVSDITWENCKSVVVRELKRLGIDLFAEIQI